MKTAIITFPGMSGAQDVKEGLMKVTNEDTIIDFVDENQTALSSYDLIFIGGGASYGDSIRPGAVANIDPVSEAVIEFSKSGKMVIGIGNGFQILTELNLLPGGFLKNSFTKPINKLVNIKVENNQTKLTNQKKIGEVISLPIAHKYGQYFVTNKELTDLKENEQILFTYKENNLNGSTDNIAGIMNKEKNVFGIMARPERAMEKILGSDDGIKFFKSIVQNFK